MFMASPRGGATVVTLTGATVSDVGSGLTASSIFFRSDGTVDRLRKNLDSDTPVQINASTDWIIPNAAASGTYEVKIEEVSSTGSASSPLFTSPAGSGNKGLSTWYSLSSDREWKVSITEANRSWSWVFDASIRAGTTVLATAEITLTVVDVTV